MQSGFTGVGTQFFPLSGDGIAIADVNVKADSLYDISIQTLSNGGETIDNLMWNDYTEWPAESGEYPGFWDNNFSFEPSTFVVKPGDGLWVQGASTSDAVQTAGQVGGEDVIVTWTEPGFKLVSNPFPVPISINDIVFNTADLYGISIQTLSNGGETVDNLMWNDYTEWPAESGEYPGFWDNNFAFEPSTLVLQPGEALWIQAAVGDSVRIPAPEL